MKLPDWEACILPKPFYWKKFLKYFMCAAQLSSQWNMPDDDAAQRFWNRGAMCYGDHTGAAPEQNACTQMLPKRKLP